MLERLKKLDKPIIYITALAILLAGFLRVVNFKYSSYFLSYGLLPYVAIRGFYFLFVWLKKKKMSRTEQLRLWVYLAIFVTILLSVLNLFSADFFVMFLIMVDYLLFREEND